MYMAMMFTGTFVGLLAIFAVVQCQFFDALYTYVLDKAADTTIPVTESREPVNVSIGMSLIQLTSLDSKSGDAEIDVWMEFRWTDTRLSWDPTNFNDTRAIRLPASRIWNPDVVLYNGHTSNRETLTVVDSTGSVMCVPPTTIKTRCYVGSYKSDGSVICRLKFGSWVYDGFLLNVVTSLNEVDLSNYNSDGTEWELSEQKVERKVIYYPCCMEPYPDVSFTLTFKEKRSRNTLWNLFD
ncbi:acetylcholine receptor subunit alpha-type acr-16-like [Haliotis asinina]|uniref:acetylcholine receptor subunit alpha-type acr-16-like n=1 Tax=Haliotis asinina TaxID=109174 RepID=UPI0035320E55